MARHGDFPTLPRFLCIRRIGVGGMGTVYEAYDRERGSAVALKTLNRAPEGRHILRFKNEFRVLQDIRHPNLVQIYELIEHDGQWCFTMELLDGVSIIEHVRPSSPSVSSAAREVVSSDVESGPSATTTISPTMLPPSDAVTDFDGSIERPGAGPIPVPFRALDVARLRAAFSQLAQGLLALHDAGTIHRDIKPSNVIVTRAGRVVVLDFGIAKKVEDSSCTLVGTPRYMAPEQLSRKAVGPAADWFAVGKVLYEALANGLPAEDGDQRFVPGARQTETTSDQFGVAIPEDLAGLCSRLLAVDPADRPTGAEVLSALGKGHQVRHGAPAPDVDDFVGRAIELSHLHRALDNCAGGIQTMVLVVGESGIGKSELVRRFGRVVGSRAVVLTGRCHERESVPYRAVDGVVDALSEYMAALGTGQAAALVPRDAALLLRAFPVLKRVTALCQAPAIDERSIAPREQRVRVFEALRELLLRLVSRAPVVVIIDDIHWADRDSLELLEEMTRAPDAPAMLIVVTLRLGADEDSNHRLVERLSRLPIASTLRVEELPPDDAERLARRLAERLGAQTGADPQTIAQEAAGHPLFIHELVRHAAGDRARAGLLRLDQAISARVHELADTARAIIEVLALAGRPLPQGTVALATAMELKPFVSHVEQLRAENLVRTDGARPGDAIELYHARFADIVRTATGARHSMIHRQLAIALEQDGSDAEALSIHWRGAGELARASHFAAVAAEEAVAGLAFDRAARLYQAAIEHAAGDGEIRSRLNARLGDALANLGRGPEAAAAYRRAAANTTGPSAIDLLGRAAAQLLRTGHIDDGIAAMTPILASRGIRMPQTPARAVASLLLRRLELAVRHPALRFRTRPAHEIAPTELARLDLLWSTTLGLFTVDQLRGLYLHARHLALALDAGEPARIARALGLEAAGMAAIGKSQRRIDRLLGRAKALNGRLEDTRTEAWLESVSAAVLYLHGKWAPAFELAVRAEAMLRERCPGASWEIDSMQQIIRWSLCYLGRLDDLRLVVQHGLREANERGDRYAAMSARSGFPNVVWLAQDDIARARREADGAIAQWSQSGFHLQHLLDLFAQVQIELYAGDGEAAVRRVSQKWRAIERTGLLRVRLNRILALDLRARAAIAGALAIGAQRQRLLNQAAADARALARTGTWGVGLSHLLSGQIATASAAPEAAVRLESAVTLLEAYEMPLHAAAARAMLARVREDSQLIAVAHAAVVGQARNVESLLGMLAPALRSLDCGHRPNGK